MKVTDEMVDAVQRALPVYRHARVRAALEAALADLPESECLQLKRDYARLHAKLASVREWLDSDDCDGTELLHWNMTLRELLDGERAKEGTCE